MQKDGQQIRLSVESGKTNYDEPVDKLLVAVGRAPNVESLNLEAAGVDYDTKAGIHVDHRLRTTNARIFAAGDVCSRFKFTHAADFMARIVIRNALFMGRAKLSALTIPWCTYTSPELAHVGLAPAEAEEQGIAIDSYTQPLDGVDWEGNLYDCDFNQMLGLSVRRGLPQNIRDFDPESLARRTIVTGQHCYGCTAGAGSGCRGAIV